MSKRTKAEDSATRPASLTAWIQRTGARPVSARAAGALAVEEYEIGDGDKPTRVLVQIAGEHWRAWVASENVTAELEAARARVATVEHERDELRARVRELELVVEAAKAATARVVEDRLMIDPVVVRLGGR